MMIQAQLTNPSRVKYWTDVTVVAWSDNGAYVRTRGGQLKTGEYAWSETVYVTNENIKFTMEGS